MAKNTIKHGVIMILLVFGYISCFSLLPVMAQDYTYSFGDHEVSIQQMNDNIDIYELLINGRVVIRYRSMYKGLSAQERAEIIFERCKLLGDNLIKENISMGKINGYPVVLNGNSLLITVTEADSKSNNSTGEGLASVWAKNIDRAINQQSSIPKSEQQPVMKSQPDNSSQQQSNTQSQPDNSLQQQSNTPRSDNTVEQQPILQPQPNNSGEQPVDSEPQPEKSGEQRPAVSEEEQRMLDLINQEREAIGLQPLTMNIELVRVARLKSQDMIDNNYFNHISPTYGDPFKMMKDYGITYVYAGENLAGSSNVTSAHDALMNSEGHKKNILNSNFNQVGIGIVDGGPYGKMFTQMFIGDGQTPVIPKEPSQSNEQQPVEQESNLTSNDAKPANISSYEQEMLMLVNAERAKVGAAPLVMDEKLVQIARLKSQDMIDNNYFDHNSPTYGDPFSMMRSFGVNYRYAGENLAGSPSVQIAHESLMNSDGHRKNILNSNYTHVGIGIVRGGPYGYMFTQLFISK